MEKRGRGAKGVRWKKGGWGVRPDGDEGLMAIMDKDKPKLV